MEIPAGIWTLSFHPLNNSDQFNFFAFAYFFLAKYECISSFIIINITGFFFLGFGYKDLAHFIQEWW